MVGYKQAAAAASASGQADPYEGLGRAAKRARALKDSALAKLLLQFWSWGKLSATLVQQLAAAATASGCKEQGVFDLAELGANGLCPNHCHRDLLRRLGACQGIPQGEPIAVPFVDPKAEGGIADEGTCTVLLPDMWLHSLHTDLPHIFMEHFCEGAQEFWQQQEDCNEKWSKSPLRQRPDLQAETVPLLVHADGGAFQKHDSMVVCSLMGLLHASGNSKQKHLMVAAWPKTCELKGLHGTWDSIWRWIVWALKACWQGVFASLDPWGRPFEEGSLRQKLAGTAIMGGKRALLWGVLADMDFLSNDLRLPGHGSRSPCYLCKCNITDVPLNDFRPAARWRATGPKDPCTDHCIMQAPGMTPMHFQLDVLHVLEYGPAAHALGNILFDIVYKRLAHLPRPEACSRVWGQILGLYDELQVPHGNRLSFFTLNCITNPGSVAKTYPSLRNMQAAEVKGLVGVVSRLHEDHHDGSVVHRHQSAMLLSLQNFYRLMGTLPMVPGRVRGQEFTKQMTAFLCHYGHLAKLAFDAGENTYSQVPKHHFSAHLAEQSVFLNCKYANCYGGEDFIGKVVSLAQSCVHGTAHFKVSATLMAKYRYAAYLQMELLG